MQVDIIAVSIHNPVAYEGFQEVDPDIQKTFDEKFIVLGGHAETLEREWKPERIVEMEF
jgi:uncharacterized protein (DUF1330 family)